MRLTVNYPDAEIRSMIMDWMYNEGVKGNEPELLNEKVSDAFGQSDIWRLESYVSEILDNNIDMPKDLMFIEA